MDPILVFSLMIPSVDIMDNTDQRCHSDVNKAVGTAFNAKSFLGRESIIFPVIKQCLDGISVVLWLIMSNFEVVRSDLKADTLRIDRRRKRSLHIDSLFMAIYSRMY